MGKKQLLRSVIFLALGIAIFWWVFRDTDMDALMREFRKVRWEWIGLSLLLNLSSLTIRAIRWKILFRPMNYNPGIFNLFLANVIMAFTNQVIPRGGEITRLSVVNRTERVPYAKIFGSVLMERLTDFIILIMLFAILIVWQLPMFKRILHLQEVGSIRFNMKNVLLTGGIIVVVILTAWFLIRKLNLIQRFGERLRYIRNDIREGFTSLARIKNKTLYFSLSITIYITSFFMFYVLFFAFPATAELSFSAAIFTFGIATSAFLLPIQAGLGAWHFLVIQALLLYGIEVESGKAFALIAHAATNLVNLPFGAIALTILALKKTTPRSPSSTDGTW